MGIPWIDLLVLLLKVVAIVGGVLGGVSVAVLAERKVSAMIQERVGPNRVGIPFLGGFGASLGLGQMIADAFKFLFKEEFTPAHVHKFYFWLAPMLAMMPALIVLAVIPFGPVIDYGWLIQLLPRDTIAWLTSANQGSWVPQTKALISDANVGLLVAFAVTSLSVYGIVLAGWASNSKYPFFGGIRSSAQLISYELTMGLSVVPILLIVGGSLRLSDIVSFQHQNGWMVFPFLGREWPGLELVLWPFLMISFVLFLVSAFAETNRLPFDLPESETELVGGYHTEYGAMKFALFFLGEYTAMIVASSLLVALFLGGWSLALPFAGFAGIPSAADLPPNSLERLLVGFLNIAVFLAKVVGVILFFMWIRWTLPRFRYDQLMALGWKVMLPLALVNVMITAGLVAWLQTQS